MFGVNNARTPGAEAMFPTFLRHAAEHPLLNSFLEAGERRALRIQDVVPLPRFELSALFREFYAVFGIRQQLLAPVAVEGRRAVVLSVFRGKESFTLAETERLNSLLPDLRTAWRHAIQIELTQREAFAQLGYEVIPLNEGFGSPPVSPSARRLLVTRWGDADWAQRLESWRNAVRATNASTAPLWATDRGVEVSGIRLADGDLALAVRASDGLGIKPRRQGNLVSWEKLTPREREVARWLVEGKTSPMIARLLGIGEPTVRKHLQHIFAKLGVENRATAIRSLLAG